MCILDCSPYTFSWGLGGRNIYSSMQQFPCDELNLNSNQHTVVKFCFLISFLRTASSSNICFPSHCGQHFDDVLSLYFMDHHSSRMSCFSVSSLFTMPVLCILVFVMVACIYPDADFCIHQERLGHAVIRDNSKISVAEYKNCLYLIYTNFIIEPK